ncbi:hypothetical protein ABZX98_34480 [Streptomyces sp. NPDC002992]|uniref:hypothetical protein n=1 Tax=Streptomyces sp. NPDC002992 TaxID=3154273 RepID=UPI0033BCE20E
MQRRGRASLRDRPAHRRRSLGFTLPLLLIPLAERPTLLVVALLFAAEFLSCAVVMVLDIAAGSFQMALIPDAVRARNCPCRSRIRSPRADPCHQ